MSSQGDSKQKLDDELPQKDEENAIMDTLESVVLTKPPSQEANSNGTQVSVDDKSKENDAEVVVNSEAQYSTNTGSHNGMVSPKCSPFDRRLTTACDLFKKNCYINISYIGYPFVECNSCDD